MMARRHVGKIFVSKSEALTGKWNPPPVTVDFSGESGQAS
jgi:hypothetical protein